MKKSLTKKKPVRFSSLKLLGNTAARFPAAPTAATLETFENRYCKRTYWISFNCPDFTSLCPVTGQPDFAKIEIRYAPDKLCVESKSLKFYLSSFRDTRSFNEEIVNRILDDLVEVCQPRRAVVRGEFAPRGGVSLTVEATYPDDLARNGE